MSRLVTRDAFFALRERIRKLELKCPADPAKQAAIDAKLAKAREQLLDMYKRAQVQS